MDHQATYSPEDDKLRLYPAHRLDAEEYARVKAMGFCWAPKQELFYAAWGPGREDFLVEMAGEIGDEDKSLVERAEERADRFDGYSERRATNSKAARRAVEAIVEHIPMGQPILVGHHSERHARKDQERIETGMRRAIKMWETAEYWKERAAGALAHAKYKELPTVRARRIKGLESDRRKQEKVKADAARMIAGWEKIKAMENDPERQLLAARAFAGSIEYGGVQVAKREGEAHFGWNAYNVLQPDDRRHSACPAMTPDEVCEVAIPAYQRIIARADRWIAHLDNRLTYERAMMAEAGGTVADHHEIKVGGYINDGRARAIITRVNLGVEGRVVSVTVGKRTVVPIERVRGYEPPTEADIALVKAATARPPLANYPGDGFLHLTSAAWEKIWKDSRGTVVVEPTETMGRHRIRYTSGICLPTSILPGWAEAKNDTERGHLRYRRYNIFLTDAREVKPPAPTGDAAVTLPPIQRLAPVVAPRPIEPPVPEEAAIKAMKQTLKDGGVKVVAVPQLFPTPHWVAAMMLDMAEVRHDHRVLEPSAGTGNLILALARKGVSDIVAVEINRTLVDRLRDTFPGVAVHDADFLDCTDMGKFDRIIMNPPFKDGSDIRHIAHALQFLRPGGRLVAICANGPRQAAKLRPLAATWTELPDDTFADQGTSVRTVLLTIEAEPARVERPKASTAPVDFLSMIGG